MKKLIAPLLLLLALTGCSALPDTTGTTANGTPKPVCQTALAEASIRTAYLVGITGGRAGLYVSGRPGNTGTPSKIALAAFEDRFQDGARTMFEQQVAGWPTPVLVIPPGINIDGVTFDKSCATATLTTHETWKVQVTSGNLLDESNRPHIVRLAKQTTSAITDDWVVTAYS